MTSTLKDEAIKRWTARRKTALVLEMIQRKTTVAEAGRVHDIPPRRSKPAAKRCWRSGREHGSTLALVIDCCSRELLGWQRSSSGRSDNGLVERVIRTRKENNAFIGTASKPCRTPVERSPIGSASTTTSACIGR